MIMTFPTPNIKITNTDVSDELKVLLERKLQPLGRYLGEETDVVCDAEFEKVTPSESGPIFRVEINLQVAGTLHRAEATLDSFEAAIDEVRDELDKELRRKHKKQDTLFKKGGRKIKEMMRFGGRS